MTFAKRFRQVMEEKKFTPSMLTAEGRISRSEIDYYLKGERIPSLRSAAYMAQLMEVTIDDLIRGVRF